MPKKKLRFSINQMYDIQNNEGVWEVCSRDFDDDPDNYWEVDNQGEQLYEVVDQEDTYFDMEKSYKNIKYTIQDCKTKKYYQAELTFSYHWDEEDDIEWKEVHPVKKTITVYE